MSAAPPAAPHAVARDQVSYWSVVGAQLRKNRVAMVAWRLVQLLIALAVGAPLLAMNAPLWRAQDGRWSFPVLEGLFDRFLFPSGVDVFFNLLLIAGPLWWLMGRVMKGVRETRAGAGSTGMVVSAAAFLFVAVVLLLAVACGARYLGWVVLAVGVPGVAAVAWSRWPARPLTARRLRAGRAACALLFLAGFVALNLVPAFRLTRPLVEQKERAAALEASGQGVAFFPPVPYHPDNTGEAGGASLARILKPPNAENWLGCDTNGRDVVARLIFGTRISLTIGLVAVAIYIAIGIVLGGLAGFYGGWVDLLISRLVEVMICFPTLFLLLTIVAVFESHSIFLIMAAIGLVGWPGVTRLVRGEFLRQRNLDYVTAARAQGVPERRIIFGHLLPNCMGPVLVSATFGVAGAILVESAIAFLGLGDQSASSWGQMLTIGRTSQQWHLILAPGFAIFFVVTVFNLLGEGIRDALDPKLRK